MKYKTVEDVIKYYENVIISNLQKEREDLLDALVKIYEFEADDITMSSIIKFCKKYGINLKIGRLILDIAKNKN